MTAVNSDIHYTANLNHGQPKPKKARSGADARYTEALEYVRAELKSGEFVMISGVEIANTFKITNTFLYLLKDLGAIERKETHKSEFICRALPQLSTITAFDILECNRVKMRQYEPRDRDRTVGPANSIMAIPFDDVFQPQPLPEAEQVEETFLVGVVENGVLSCKVTDKYVSHSYAKAMLELSDCLPGQKIVLLKVLSVVEPIRVLQPSTL